MLSISSPLPLSQAQYYVGLTREDCYENAGEPLGEWRGEGRKRVSLSGPVSSEDFLSVFTGDHPQTGKALVRNAGSADRQCGWDLVFSPPKSVSILWALSPEHLRIKIQDAHERAVKSALAYLEDTVGYVRRGAGGVKKERAELLFASFQHGVSRALDPQLHSHAICLNVGFSRSRYSGALYSNPIFENKMAAGGVYQSALAYQLVGLGFSVTPKNGSFSVEGIPEALCERFSKRRVQILHHLEERGLQSAVAAKIAAVTTRESKITIPRKELFSAWCAQGEDFGFSHSEILALQKSQRISPPKLSASELGRNIISSFEAENTAQFSRADIVSYISRECISFWKSEKFALDAVEYALSDSRLMGVGFRFEEPIFTTQELMRSANLGPAISVNSDLMNRSESCAQASNSVLFRSRR